MGFSGFCGSVVALLISSFISTQCSTTQHLWQFQDVCHCPINQCYVYYNLSLLINPCPLVMEMSLFIRDAPVDRPKIGTGRFLLIMRDRQPAGFCLFFGRFFRKCEHVICVEDIRQEHNNTQKNRYNEANCRWCNITGTQIRAAFLCCSSWSCLWWVGLERFIHFERIFNETREERVVSGSDSFSRACAPS